jgi:hypothetical protein
MVYYQKTYEDNLLAAEVEYELAQKRFLEKKKEFTEIEERLVSAKENIIKAQEELRIFKSTWILSDDVSESRIEDIDSFKKRLPAALEKIKYEKILESFKCGEIGTKKFSR